MLSLRFPSFLILPSRFLLGLARTDARANLPDPPEGEEWRKKRTKKKTKVLFMVLRNGSLLLKYALAVGSAGSYAYIDLPARYGVNIHAGKISIQHGSFNRERVRLEKANAPGVWISCFIPGPLIAISDALTTNSLLSRKCPEPFPVLYASSVLFFAR